MLDNQYLVSVILPTHNSAKWVQSSIRSVLSQSHTNLELIVIDDGSSDETITIVSKLADADDRLKFIALPTCSGGPATPRNQGIEIATGNYLAFIDSDDLWHPQKLELQLLAMKAHGLNFLSSQHSVFQSTPPETTKIKFTGRVRRKNAKHLILKNWVVTSSAIVKKSLLRDTRFNQKAEYNRIEDYLLWLDLHQDPSITSGVLMSPLVLYRLRSDSLSASKSVMARKIFFLLSNYSINGKPLGLRKYFYFTSYLSLAIFNRLKLKVLRK